MLTLTRKSLYWMLIKLFTLALFAGPFIDSAFGLGELFSIYDSPQGLAMGNALTADAMGYTANYYNPAGLAKANKRQWELTPIALELMPSLKGLGRLLSIKSTGLAQIANEMQRNPGQYYYHRGNFVPAATRRGMGFALLTSTQLAGRSDGTNFDVFAVTDVVPTFGVATNLAGNILKVGITGKLIMRRELKGQFAHATIGDSAAADAQHREGMGAGADIGLLLTAPIKYLPTLGVVWRDVLNTHFFGTSYVFARSATGGRPQRIDQSVHAAFSVHPYIGRNWRTLLSFEFKYIDRSFSSLPWQKRSHAGLQIEYGKHFYFWAGANQLYWTGGMGMRVRGGNLEIGSYGVDVGDGTTREEDRRFFLRYTIGF